MTDRVTNLALRILASLLTWAILVGRFDVALADDEEMVSFPARILKVETLEHDSSPTGNRVAGLFGALGVLLHQASLQSKWYKLSNPDGEEIGIESSGTFVAGQCVLVSVRKVNAQNTKLFPGVSRLEPNEGCTQ